MNDDGWNLKRLHDLRQSLREQKELSVKIISGSMRPLIEIDDVVSVIPIDDVSEIKPFDVVVFLNGDYLTCHYVLKQSHFASPNGTKLFLTRGLDAAGVDLPVNEGHILGKAVVKIPLFYRVREAIRNFS